MGQLRERGATILLVEQNARRTMRFADACYLLQAGQVAGERLTPAMADDPTIIDAYLGGAKQ
jgi:branched-chain amino acid transport system ATP-binding protein